MTRRASCSCGLLSVTCEGEPVRISMCHCLACQQRTGSVFGAQARFPRERVEVHGEEHAGKYVRVGDSGGRLTFHFCRACGSTVYWEMDTLPELVAVAIGAFADPSFPAPRVSVYEARRHAWVPVAQLDVEHHE